MKREASTGYVRTLITGELFHASCSRYRDERFRQQEIGNNLVQLALKYLINGCYGLFGTDFFEFNDYRVAELTTAIGRLTLQQMQHIAKEVYGFDIIYGDTDSLFVTNVKSKEDIKKFVTECYILLGMDVEVADIYEKFLITKKKHYIGISQDESTSSPNLISRRKYLKMLRTAVQDGLKAMGYDFDGDILGQYKIHGQQNN